MKYFFSFLFIAVFGLMSTAQGTIQSFSISPESPINTDTIYVYANLSFTNGDCDLLNQSHSVAGTNVYADALHCLGVLDYLCMTVDTFKINPLPTGEYTFSLSLSSGMAPAPCTPGIVPDQDSTFSFSVGTVGLKDDILSQIRVYPNPVTNQINFTSVPDGTIYNLTAITGQVVKFGTVKNNQIVSLGSIPAGMYFLKLETVNGHLIQQIIKE